MFGFFKKDPTAKKKHIKEWQHEHRELRKLLEKIADAYEREDHKTLRKLLIDLEVKVVDHLLSEDTIFFEILRSVDGNDPKYTDTVEMIEEFRKSFGGAKVAVMEFLVTYTAHNAKYDRKFKENFDTIAKALSERIFFEETHCYGVINH